MAARPSAGRILLLWNRTPEIAGMIVDHVEALTTLSAHRVDALTIDREIPAACVLDDYDAVIIHYSIFIAEDAYLSPLARFRLRRFSGAKAMFIQDEYRFVNKTIEAMSYIGIDLVFTCVPQPQIRTVYPESRLPRCRFVTTLTGYVPDRLRSLVTPPISERAVDVCYRGRTYPLWHGELGRDRTRIAELFAQQAGQFGLVVDISTRECDRIYGAAWLDFMAGAKAVLGTESGCNVLDVDGDLGDRIEIYQMLRPWASYAAIHRRFLDGIEGAVRLNQISPRCFEAIATHTLLILYEGEYSGILQPWVHYAPLRRDHSNIAEIVSVLRDAAGASEIIRTAHRDVVASGRFGYRSFVAEFDRELAELIGATSSQVRANCRPSPAWAPTSAPHTRLKQRFLPLAMRVYANLPAGARIWAKHLLRTGVHGIRRAAAIARLTLALAMDGTMRGLALNGLRTIGPRGAWTVVRLVWAARRIVGAVEMRAAADLLVLSPVDRDTPSVARPRSIVWTGGSRMGIAGALGCPGPWHFESGNAPGIAHLVTRICDSLSLGSSPTQIRLDCRS